MSALVGTQLSGRYRLDAQVGTGGMSTVYRAFDATLERRVAIKLMHRDIAADSDQLERFRREARAVAQLSHPHIVGVIDAGEDEGRPYIVFEYVEGETLKDRIRRLGRLPVDEAIAYAIEIARALGAAHGRGIVHRDVKPQNVLVDEEGSAKVTDFGIARSMDDSGLTAEGRVLGTTDYVSPEQALGHDVNGQSDIYSLGIVLYEMLTGDVPFHGENQVAVAMKHVREDLPDVQRRRPEVSAGLAAILDRMTAKDLKKRYPDALSLQADLEEALARELSRTGHSTGEATAILATLPESARRRLPLRIRRPLPIVALVALIAVAVAIVAILAKEGIDRTESGTGQGTAKPASRATASCRSSAPPPRPSTRSATTRSTPPRSRSPSTRTAAPPGAPSPTRAATSARTASGSTSTPTRAWTPARSRSTRTRRAGRPRSASPTARSRRRTSATGSKVAGGDGHQEAQALRLNGDRHRYYLVWITDLGEGNERVSITEIALFAPRAT